jgi:hypothetical protein
VRVAVAGACGAGDQAATLAYRAVTRAGHDRAPVRGHLVGFTLDGSRAGLILPRRVKAAAEPDVLKDGLDYDLLIRSYWRVPAPFDRCSSVCVRMPAHDSCSAHGLLYPTAKQDGRRQRACVASSSRSQVTGRSASHI